MEIETVKDLKAPVEAPSKKAKGQSKVVVRKFDAETYKVLASLKERTNKKQFGRKVKELEIIKLGLELIGESHIKDLQAATLSEQDKLMIAHADYSRTHGKISLDQFIGKLLKGQISPKNDNHG